MPTTADPAKVLDRYLNRYAEPIVQPASNARQALLDCVQQQYRWVLIVPAFDEPPDFTTELLRNIHFETQAHALLVIRVVNAPADAASDARTRTLASLSGNRGQPLALNRIRPGIDQLTLDAATHPLPAKEATGLARKLGNDVACTLMRNNRVRCWLLCNTDADAVLPGNYFQRLAHELHASELAGPPAPAAWIMPFRHTAANAEHQLAGALYELYLRSLYLQLERCGSPYAYPALGSVLAVSPQHYARVRGFPKRRAGEDFYLLNKLIKTAPVIYLNGAPVILQARASHRVPFGTGPAIATALAQDAAQYPTYASASYELLARFYAGFAELGATRQHPSDRRSPGAVSVRSGEPLAWQDPDLKWLVKRLGVSNALLRLRRNHPTSDGLRRALHEWFDALKIVRFLNAARHFHPDEPLLATLSSLMDEHDDRSPERVE